MYELRIGDVIKNGEDLLVVADMINFEDFGSCCYDRKYLLCDFEYLQKNQGIVTVSDLEEHGKWIVVKGMEFPVFEKTEIAPFAIEEVACCMIRQKTAKTITVYE